MGGLANIKCFSTDGEQALVDAFQHEFPKSAHLTCSIHVRRNTKAKLQELGIADCFKKVILSDLFGKKEGSPYTEGLVDSTSTAMYDNVFDTLVENWRKLHVSTSSVEVFIQWFSKYKSPVVKGSMLKCVRQRCGLRSPPAAFTTNASGSMNAMLKRKVDYKRNELYQLLHQLKALIDVQEQEIQMAVVDRGKYSLQPEYKKFKKSEDVLFLKMNESDGLHNLQWFAAFNLASLPVPSGEQQEGSLSYFTIFERQAISASPQRSCDTTGMHTSTYSRPSSEDPPSSKHVKCQLFVTNPNSPLMPVVDDVPRNSYTSCISQHYFEESSSTRLVKHPLITPTQLLVDVADFVDKVNIPKLVLHGEWKKATNLLTNANAITKAPGSDQKAHLVIISTGNIPHMVTLRKNGQYICDKSCANWNSLRICSHTVAVAELNRDLSLFLSWLIKSKRRPSLTKLVVTNMPDGRYKKGGRSASHKKVIQTVTRTPIASVLSGHIDDNTPQNSVPTCPPPLVHVSSQNMSPHTTEPFELCFICGNISVCYGCCQKYVKPCSPPNDLCVKHKEWREYFPPGSATS